MTLDEPVWHTVKRDLLQVGSKLQVVLLPRENQDGVLKKLKDCECVVARLCLPACLPVGTGACGRAWVWSGPTALLAAWQLADLAPP